MATISYSPDNTGGVQTTDTTPATMCNITIPADGVGSVDAVVVAKSTDDIHAMWRLTAAIRRNGSASATIVGSVLNVVSPQKDIGALLWAATLVVSGNDVVVQVVGASSKTIEWAAVSHGLLLGL